METQMFERLIEEKIDNPSQPEIIFFDQTIARKGNRKLKTLVGGRKNTAFLNDRS